MVDVLRPQTVAATMYQQYRQQYEDRQSCKNITVLTSVLGVYSELLTSDCQPASHCNMHCLQSYSFPDKAQGLVSVNPRAVWAELFTLLVEI
jgi:hypothetical protein